MSETAVELPRSAQYASSKKMPFTILWTHYARSRNSSRQGASAIDEQYPALRVVLLAYIPRYDTEGR